MQTAGNIPIVFLHGFLGSPLDWHSVCSFLPNHHCITINLPGHSKTPFTTDFTEWMPSYNQFHLVGYSLGGRLALQYAKSFPHKIASLTLASSHFGLRTTKEKKQRLLQDQIWAQKLASLPLEDFLTIWYKQTIFHHFKPDFTKRLEHDPQELSKALVHFSLAKQPLIKPKKALILVGEKDMKYREIHPQATIIPNAAHMVHLENPSAFAQFLQLHIQSYPQNKEQS